MISRSPTFWLVTLYCVLLLVLGAGFAWFTVLTFEHYTRETIIRETAARSGEIWVTAIERLDDRTGLARVIEQRFAPEALDRFIRISEGGRILYQSAIPAGVDARALQGSRGKGDAAQLRLGSLFLNRHFYVTPQGRRILVESGQSDVFAQGVQKSLTQSLVFGLPVLLILAAFGGYVLMRRSLHPIERMIDAAEAISFNDPGNRLPLAETGDRLETLGLALNRMLDRLDAAYQHANRFSADAAHEIRTPLAIIRGELEFLAAQRHSPELHAALGNILDEANRLSDMVEKLAMLSRMDSLWGKHAHAEFDLGALAGETMDQMRLLADEKHITLAPLQGGPAPVAGDRNRLKQVLVNLVDNAIKYTPEGGRITVEVKSLANRAQLTVTDNGIGVAPEHREKIFDRFYRVSTDRGETGSGLGLAIAKSICNAHGGTIVVDSTPGAGSTFRIELPLSTA
ncbi:MAG TPA: HAMP domain-containing sensor histidine kinase [Rhizomicrobium sp.]|nr:HAMP domain-containing sensor histidine kinase [Rhizomicrobium sp.]